MNKDQAGRPESNVFISGKYFDYFKELSGKSNNDLAEELYVSYRTIQRARNEQTISYTNLIKLCKIWDVAPFILQEDGIENWTTLNKEEQEAFKKRFNDSNARFDNDGHYLPTFHEYEEAENSRKAYLKQAKDQLEFDNKINNSLVEIVRPFCLTPFSEDAEEIDKFLKEYSDDILLDLHESINKRIREYMMMHSDDDPRYAFMREMFNSNEDKY